MKLKICPPFGEHQRKRSMCVTSSVESFPYSVPFWLAARLFHYHLNIKTLSEIYVTVRLYLFLGAGLQQMQQRMYTMQRVFILSDSFRYRAGSSWSTVPTATPCLVYWALGGVTQGSVTMRGYDV